MKLKSIVFVVITLLLASCKREYSASFNSSATSSINSVKGSEKLLIAENSRGPIYTSTERFISSSMSNKVENAVGSTKKIVIKKDKSKNQASIKIIKEVKKITKVTKERDPRLSRALIMTIFGGLATGLGILASSVAPTGLLVFIFGVIFIIGVVSLIMYLANPRPKM